MRPAFLLALSGCGMVLPPEVPAVPRVVAVRPAPPLAPDARIEIELSAPVSVRGARSPIAVRLEDGRAVPAAVRVDARLIRIAPVDRWPAAPALQIRVGVGLVDEFGQAVAPFELALALATPAPAPSAAILAPLGPAPTNLRFVVVSSTAPMEHAWLDGGAHAVPAAVIERDPAGRTLLALPRAEGACGPLCPGAVYRLRAGPLDVAGAIESSTHADERPARADPPEVEVLGPLVRIRVRADEPVRARALVYDGGEIELESPLPFAPLTAMEIERLSPARLLAGLVWTVDLAGNHSEAQPITISTPPEIAVELTELVPTPRRDWGDSTAAGEPFDPWPGSGAVSDADEWMELVNRSAAAIDLARAGLRVLALDGTPSETALVDAPALRFGAGGHAGAWAPGEALVVRLRGAMAASGLVLEVFAGNERLDVVHIGPEPDAAHAGGAPPDLEHEAIAKDARGRFRWCVPSPGDPSPARRCR